MSWVAVGTTAISAGATLASSKKGGASVNVPESQKAAANELLNIGQQGAPNIPVRGVAGMSDLEKLGMTLAEGYARNPSDETLTALNMLKEVGGYKNTFDVPEYQNLYGTMKKDASNELNRVGRSLQLSGNTSSSTGAGVVSKSIGDIMSRMMGTMAPYAQDLLNKRMNAPIMAADIRNADTTNRINTATQVGSLSRQLEQLGLDAQNQVDREMALFDYLYRAPVLSAAAGASPPTVVQPNNSTFANVAPLIGQSLAGLLNGNNNNNNNLAGNQAAIQSAGGLSNVANSSQLSNWMNTY